jgi:glutamyl-tRNA synthetase
MTNKIITRFAPSPTGLLHIGSARTALFVYLFTRQNNGKYILRMEDTDKERSKPENEKEILESLEWLGLENDEFIRQSDNLDYHKACLKKLIDNDLAYFSKEEIIKEGDRAEVIRFRNPGKQITFKDLIHGEIVFDTTELGDFVIAKDLDTPIFHLANVADDIKSGVTHVIRGEDHISNTPRQILLFEALGALTIPTYAHIPLILDSDRAKLSKRKHGAFVWISEYRKNGYLPEAMNNYLALLGWSPQAANNNEAGTDDEILFMEELLKRFDISKVQKKSAIFDLEKLNWLNREYIKRQSQTAKVKEIVERCPTRVKELSLYSEEKLSLIAPLLVERINNYSEVTDILGRGDFDFFFTTPAPNRELLKGGPFLRQTLEMIKEAPNESFADPEEIKKVLWDFATLKGRGEVLWPMRVALTGQAKSPDPFTVASILGKEETIKRLIHAEQILL